MNSYYEDTLFSEEDLKTEKHRQCVGHPAVWEEQSKLQLDLCKKYGLLPTSKLLDFGCGCLRGGIKLMDFLDRGNYFGIDVNRGLLKAGLEYEVPKANLQEKLILENFLITNSFELEYFNTEFDMIIAQSVFTHLPLNHLDFFSKKACGVLRGSGKILLSFWFIQEHEDITKEKIFEFENFATTTSYIFDSFHYKFSQIKKLLKDLWVVTLLDDYHPRKQQFVMLTKKS